ncbi:MAG: hypothetical protein U0790_27460 [Isosphaeraceae bacterium]
MAEAAVVSSVADQTDQIKGRRDAPIVCNLPPGWHDLVVKRGHRLEVGPSKNVALDAWDPKRAGDGPRPSP